MTVGTPGGYLAVPPAQAPLPMDLSAQERARLVDLEHERAVWFQVADILEGVRHRLMPFGVGVDLPMLTFGGSFEGMQAARLWMITRNRLADHGNLLGNLAHSLADELLTQSLEICRADQVVTGHYQASVRAVCERPDPR